MFLDENAVPAVSPAQIEDWRRILLDAADYIETNGWLQDAYFTAEEATGPACVMGAIVGPGIFDDWPYYDQVQRDAITRLAEALFAIDEETDIEAAVTGWNDYKDRTKEEVIAKLREVARS
jgi:hypothetical protein